jgi:hypothetical protein
VFDPEPIVTFIVNSYLKAILERRDIDFWGSLWEAISPNAEAEMPLKTILEDRTYEHSQDGNLIKSRAIWKGERPFLEDHQSTAKQDSKNHNTGIQFYRGSSSQQKHSADNSQRSHQSTITTPLKQIPAQTASPKQLKLE